MDTYINRSKLIKVLAAIAIILTLIHLALMLTFFVLSYDIPAIRHLVYLFALDQEKNVPTFFSSLILLFSALLLALIAACKKKELDGYPPSWTGLSVIFLYLSMDEFVELHERLSPLAKALFNTSGLLTYAWVIPYGIFLVIFAIVYFRFTMNLPAITRKRFILAGAIYVFGAVVVDMLSGYHRETYGNGVGYHLYTTVEEVLEMGGIILFIDALMEYMGSNLKKFQLRISSE